jgi:hypothetical protein
MADLGTDANFLSKRWHSAVRMQFSSHAAYTHKKSLAEARL